MATTEEQIKKMYQSQIDTQKEQLKQDYLQADSDLSAQKDKAQKATDANLNRTMVEAQKAAVSNAELRNASGLSSGAAAQARLSESNQLQSNLTALRAQQQEVDAEAERQRSLLAQEYSSAIRQAQAENDLAKAQALYEEAQRQNDALLSAQQETAKQQLTAAQLMAGIGNYDRLAKIYGLTSKEAAMLSDAYKAQELGLVQDELVSDNAKTFIDNTIGADDFAKWGYVEIDGKGISDYKTYVKAKLDQWANGTEGNALTNADLAYLVQYYGLG